MIFPYEPVLPFLSVMERVNAWIGQLQLFRQLNSAISCNVWTNILLFCSILFDVVIAIWIWNWKSGPCSSRVFCDCSVFALNLNCFLMQISIWNLTLFLFWKFMRFLTQFHISANERTIFSLKRNGKVPGYVFDGMTSDTNGILYIATFGGHKVMKIDPK